MNELLTKVKQNLILEHSADDELISGFITAAVSYAESYQHIEQGYYTDNPMPPTTEQAVIMLSSHFYESRDGSTGGFFGDNVQAGKQVWDTVNMLLRQAVESMSFGKMNTQIQITQKRVTLDDEGFQTESDVVVATVRAYREGRHGSEKWANRAAFSEATDLFRFRTIPGVKISTDMRLICGDSAFEITSVEDVKGRGMYIEALAKEVKPSG